MLCGHDLAPADIPALRYIFNGLLTNGTFDREDYAILIRIIEDCGNQYEAMVKVPRYTGCCVSVELLTRDGIIHRTHFGGPRNYLSLPAEQIPRHHGQLSTRGLAADNIAEVVVCDYTVLNPDMRGLAILLNLGIDEEQLQLIASDLTALSNLHIRENATTKVAITSTSEWDQAAPIAAVPTFIAEHRKLKPDRSTTILKSGVTVQTTTSVNGKTIHQLWNEWREKQRRPMSGDPLQGALEQLSTDELEKFRNLSFSGSRKLNETLDKLYNYFIHQSNRLAIPPKLTVNFKKLLLEVLNSSIGGKKSYLVSSDKVGSEFDTYLSERLIKSLNTDDTEDNVEIQRLDGIVNELIRKNQAEGRALYFNERILSEQRQQFVGQTKTGIMRQGLSTFHQGVLETDAMRHYITRTQSDSESIRRLLRSRPNSFGKLTKSRIYPISEDEAQLRARVSGQSTSSVPNLKVTESPRKAIKSTQIYLDSSDIESDPEIAALDHAAFIAQQNAQQAKAKKAARNLIGLAKPAPRLFDLFKSSRGGNTRKYHTTNNRKTIHKNKTHNKLTTKNRIKNFLTRKISQYRK